MPSKKALIIYVVVFLVLVLLIFSCSDNESADQVPQSTPTANAFSFSEQPEDGLRSPTATVTAVSSDWDCEIINSNTASGYNSALPMIPNAFRAIEKAGNSSIWEQGPFKWTDRYGVEHIVETRPELSTVHNGDEICVMP